MLPLIFVLVGFSLFSCKPSEIEEKKKEDKAQEAHIEPNQTADQPFEGDRLGKVTIATGKSQVPVFFLNGEVFSPRGVNYVRLKPREDNGILWHATFDVDHYHASEVDKALTAIANHGYQLVRVFLNLTTDKGIIGGLTEPGLNPSYMANLWDFLTKARQNKLRVTIASKWVPVNYAAKFASLNNDVKGTNAMYLNPQHIEALKLFHRDFSKAIADHHFEDTVFSIDLVNEGQFDQSAYPLDQLSGTFAIAGQSYDLSVAEQRSQMINDSIKRWIALIKKPIKENLPTVFVSLSVFSPFHTQSDTRMAFSLKTLHESEIDYLDTHLYANSIDLIATELSFFGLSGQKLTKPWIIGETGALSKMPMDDAKDLFEAILVKSCEAGATGWLGWTWDTKEQPKYYDLQAENGALNSILAPLSDQRFSCGD